MGINTLTDAAGTLLGGGTIGVLGTALVTYLRHRRQVPLDVAALAQEVAARALEHARGELTSAYTEVGKLRTELAAAYEQVGELRTEIAQLRAELVTACPHADEDPRPCVAGQR